MHLLYMDHRSEKNDEMFQLLQRKFPIPEFLFCLFTCDAVSLLYLAGEYAAFSSNDVHIVIGEFAPLLPDRSFDLLPVPYELMAVHDLFLFS